VADFMKKFVKETKAEIDTIKAIKLAPVENSEFKNIMKIMNRIYQK